MAVWHVARVDTVVIGQIIYDDQRRAFFAVRDDWILWRFR